MFAARRRRQQLARFEGEVAVTGELEIEVIGDLHLGSRISVRSSPVRSHIYVGGGGSLTIGDDVTIAHGCGISCQSTIEIGAGATLGAFVQLLDSDFHLAADRDQDSEPRPIRVGRGAIVGAWSIVLPGADIGDGAIIEPGSVVVGVIGHHVRAGGNPANESTSETTDDRRPSVLVPAVFAEVLGLSEAPELDARRESLVEWSSLGSVRILAALERKADVRISERAVYQAETVRDIVDALEQALTVPTSAVI